MKRLLVFLLCLIVCAGLCHARMFSFGAHGAYTVGGDVEDEGVGYGAQLAIGGENLALELSVTVIEDEIADSPADFDIGSVGLSLILGGNMSEQGRIYVGGGVNYNRFEFDSDTPLEYEDDDQVGFHALAGLAVSVTEWLELFAEYRYTLVKYETSAEEDFGHLDLDELDEDYDFGFVRAGLNLVL